MVITEVTFTAHLVVGIGIGNLEYVFYFLFGVSIGIGNRNTYFHFITKMSLRPFQKTIVIGIDHSYAQNAFLFSISMPATK